MRTTVTLGVAVLGLAAAAPAAAEPGSPVEIEHGTLLVRGGAEADVISLEVPRYAPQVLRVEVGDDGHELKRSRFDRIRTESGAGEDEVRVEAPRHTDLEPVASDGGDGSDALSGGPRGDILADGDGSDRVFGSQGDDVASLGDDQDLYEWEPGDGDDTVDGGSGHDSIRATGADVPERFELAAHGRRLRVARDLEAVDADDVEEIATEARGGADTITIGDLRRTGVEEVHAALANASDSEDPDGAADRVVVTGTERRDTLAVLTAGGDDTVDSSGLPAGLIGLDVE